MTDVSIPQGFCGFIYAPYFEQEVVGLFCLLLPQLPESFAIEELRETFPDCIARRTDLPDKPVVRIELELFSRKFLEHRHDPEECDLIVCWEHNWPASPLPVLSLKAFIEERGIKVIANLDQRKYEKALWNWERFLPEVPENLKEGQEKLFRFFLTLPGEVKWGEGPRMPSYRFRVPLGRTGKWISMTDVYADGRYTAGYDEKLPSEIYEELKQRFSEIRSVGMELAGKPLGGYCYLRIEDAEDTNKFCEIMAWAVGRIKNYDRM